jgi:hypothetical protein
MVDKHCVAPATASATASQVAAAKASMLTPVQEEDEDVKSMLENSEAQLERARSLEAKADAALAERDDDEEAAVKSMLGKSESQLEKARSLEAKADAFLKKRNMPAVSETRKRKSGGCPGGPQAYNKFVKDWIAKQRAAGREITHQQALKEIKETGAYTESCGLPPKKNVTRKAAKTPAITPGRVNAVVPPPAPAPAPAATPQEEAEAASTTPLTQANQEASSPSFTPPEESVTPPPPQEESVTPPVESYEDLGMDNTTGMRRITANGRNLFMTNGNSGLFERNGNAPGNFVGYLRDGKIEPASPPEV